MLVLGGVFYWWSADKDNNLQVAALTVVLVAVPLFLMWRTRK